MTRLGQLCTCLFLLFAGYMIFFGFGFFDKDIETPVTVVQSFDAAANSICGDKTKSSFMIYFFRKSETLDADKHLLYFATSRDSRNTSLLKVDLEALGEAAKDVPVQLVAGPLNWDKNGIQVRNISAIHTRAFPMLVVDHTNMIKAVTTTATFGASVTPLFDCRDAIAFAWPK